MLVLAWLVAFAPDEYACTAAISCCIKSPPEAEPVPVLDVVLKAFGSLISGEGPIGGGGIMPGNDLVPLADAVLLVLPASGLTLDAFPEALASVVGF